MTDNPLGDDWPWIVERLGEESAYNLAAAALDMRELLHTLNAHGPKATADAVAAYSHGRTANALFAAVLTIGHLRPSAR